ncbi:MAG TPA: hypothetical protein ENJ16_04450 [Planctomycetaceae bacterium]|nr:hypothetical protein [Planctomycetaceae bacterium]
MRRAMVGGVVLVLVSVLVVQAQPPERGKGGKGRRGPRGGFGMMMGRGGMSLEGLLRNEKVREELDLLEPQIEELKKLAESMRGQRPDFSRFREMSQEERRKAFEKMREEAAKRAKQMEAKIKEILLPEQWERLQQIRIQAMGIRALTDPDVQAKLKLTEEQVQKMRSAFEEVGRKMMELFRSGQRDKIASMREEMEKKLLGILTDEQKAAFEKLKGKKVDFELRPQFRRGGPGRRGGRGGEGRGRGR